MPGTRQVPSRLRLQLEHGARLDQKFWHQNLPLVVLRGKSLRVRQHDCRDIRGDFRKRDFLGMMSAGKLLLGAPRSALGCAA